MTVNQNRNLTFCITELDVGGAEKALVRIAIGLQNFGWQVNVISLRDKGPMAIPLRDAGITVQALEAATKWQALRKLKAQFVRYQPALVCGFLHEASLLGRVAAWQSGVPVFVSGVRVADRRRSVVWTERLTKRWVHHYVAVGQNVAEVHGRICGINSDRLTAIPNGIDLPQNIQREDSDLFRILFVGRLTEQKDPISAVKAFSALPVNVRRNCRLTLLGEGELRPDLESLIAAEQLHDQVELIGQTNDVSTWMQSSDLLLLPSLWEGMPNVILEAMAHRLPVLATDVDGTSELIQHEKTGWLVPAGNVGTMAEQLIQCELAERGPIAEAAFNFVAEFHNWKTVIQSYSDLFQSLIRTQTIAR